MLNRPNKTFPIKNRIAAADLPLEYKLGSLKGSGSYGVVYAGLNSITNKKIAVKKVTNVFKSSGDAKRCFREIEISRMVKDHPNLVSIERLVAPKNSKTFNEVHMILQYGDTNLQKLINSDQYFSNEKIQYLLYQLLCGINYLHSAHVVHRDLKPANILVNKNCHLRICDFGLSRATELIDNLKDKTLKKNFRKGANTTHSISPAKKTAENIPGKVATKPLDIYQGTSASLPNVNSVNVASSIKPPPLLRTLTDYICTRWYRAPEIILLSKTYGKPSDMWSIGCILAELLMMQKETGYIPSKRTALFPGNSCYPFSGETKDVYQNNDDQLNVIFNTLGTPSSEDIAALDNPKSKKYLSNLNSKTAEDLSLKFPGVDPAAIELLKKLLEFNPAKRITAKEALNHPYLKQMVNKNKDLTYPIKKSAEDENSLMQYYRMEIEFETQQTGNPTESKDSNINKLKPNISYETFNKNLVRDLIIEEVKRDKMVTIVEEKQTNNTKSLNSTSMTQSRSILFQKQLPKAQAKAKTNSTLQKSVSHSTLGGKK